LSGHCWNTAHRYQEYRRFGSVS